MLYHFLLFDEQASGRSRSPSPRLATGYSPEGHWSALTVLVSYNFVFFYFSLIFFVLFVFVFTPLVVCMSIIIIIIIIIVKGA